MRKRYFEWIEGEQQGIVEILHHISQMEGEYFYNFVSGETCNMRFIAPMTRTPGQLKGKVMVEIMSPNDPWTFSEVSMGKFKDSNDQIIEYPPLEDITGATGTGDTINVGESALGKKKKTPPRYDGQLWGLPTIEEWLINDEPAASAAPSVKARPAVQKPADEADAPRVAAIQEPVPTGQTRIPVEPQPVQQPVQPQPQQEVFSYQHIEREKQGDSPIEILAKACKKAPTDINLTITVDLPGKSVFEMVNSEFEGGGPMFVDCLISKININDIISSLRDALLSAYMEEKKPDNEEG